MSRRAAKAAATVDSDDDDAAADANEEAVEVDSSDEDVAAAAKPAAKKGSKRADHVRELLGQLEETYESYQISGSDKNTSKNMALLQLVQKLSLNELAAPNNSQLTDKFLNEIEKTAFALDQFSIAMRKLSHASNKTSPSRLALSEDMAEFVEINKTRMQGLVAKKRKPAASKPVSSASKKKAKTSEVQIATDHSISKLERQISVLESELAPGSQIKRLIDQAENALSRADEDIQNAKDEIKSTLESFTNKNPMPDEWDDEDAYAAWSKQKTKVLAPKKTKLKQCKDAKSSAEQSLADNTKILENKQSDLAALQIQLQNIEE